MYPKSNEKKIFDILIFCILSKESVFIYSLLKLSALEKFILKFFLLIPNSVDRQINVFMYLKYLVPHVKEKF